MAVISKSQRYGTSVSFFLLILLTAVVVATASKLLAEELLGDEAIAGSKFPRIIGGHRITEGQYSVYVRECAVAIYFLEKPIADMDELRLSLQLEYFILGASFVSAKSASYYQFLDLVKQNCRSTAGLTLSEAVDLTALAFTSKLKD